MKIGYRRYAGRPFLTTAGVTSKRGAWLEKRIAFIDALKERGHEVIMLNNHADYDQCDLIFVEFGSTNRMFYSSDIDYTESIVTNARCRKILLLDDPALVPLGLRFDGVWVNGDAEASYRYLVSKNQGYQTAKVEEFPFYALQEMIPPKEDHNGKVVYYGGTSGGREERITLYKRLLPNLEIYGDPKNYKTLIPKDPPEQKDRQSFYNNFMACFSITDNFHKKLGWHTGRYYHAVMAGCPAIDEARKDAIDVLNMMRETSFRKGYIWGQQALVEDAKNKCLELFKSHGI